MTTPGLDAEKAAGSDEYEEGLAGICYRRKVRRQKSSRACKTNRLRLLLEDDCSFVIQQDSVFDVPANRAREDHLFQVAPFFHQVVERIAMGDARNALFDDGAVIEYFGDIVRGGANELYAAPIGLVVGLCADESWQERVMDINNGHWVLGDEVGRKHLHVTREHHHVDVIGGQQFELPRFGLRL